MSIGNDASETVTVSSYYESLSFGCLYEFFLVLRNLEIPGKRWWH